MLLMLDRLLHTPVMSLQTGAELARVKDILIDPRDLTVVAYELEGPVLDQHPSFLRPIDVRELSSLGFIVDSNEEFIGLDDVIKVKEVYEFNFTIIGLDVVDDTKHKLGRVQSYNVDAGSFAIQQLIIRRPLLHSFTESELLVHRTQILEINDVRILVKSTSGHEPVRDQIREYTNPFRKSSAQPESIDAERH